MILILAIAQHTSEHCLTCTYNITNAFLQLQNHFENSMGPGVTVVVNSLSR